MKQEIKLKYPLLLFVGRGLAAERVITKISKHFSNLHEVIPYTTEETETTTKNFIKPVKHIVKDILDDNILIGSYDYGFIYKDELISDKMNFIDCVSWSIDDIMDLMNLGFDYKIINIREPEEQIFFDLIYYNRVIKEDSPIMPKDEMLEIVKHYYKQYNEITFFLDCHENFSIMEKNIKYLYDFINKNGGIQNE